MPIEPSDGLEEPVGSHDPLGPFTVHRLAELAGGERSDHAGAGRTVTAIAAAAGVSRQTAHTWMAPHGLAVEPGPVRPTPAALRRLYAAESSTAAVARRLDVSDDTARRWLLAAGAELPAAGRPRARLDIAELRARRAEGATWRELADDAGVTVTTLRRRLRQEAERQP